MKGTGETKFQIENLVHISAKLYSRNIAVFTSLLASAVGHTDVYMLCSEQRITDSVNLVVKKLGN